MNMAEQINQSEDTAVAKKKTDMVKTCLRSSDVIDCSTVQAKTASKLEDKEKAVVEKKKKKSAKQAELDAAVAEAKLAEAKDKKDKKVRVCELQDLARCFLFAAFSYDLLCCVLMAVL